jgi:hypothetical protein
MHSPSQGMDEVFFALCKTIDTPVSLGCWLKYKYDQIELCSSSVDPAKYERPSAFAADYLICEFLSKYKGLQTGIDTKAVGLSKFTLAEERNLDSNRRIRNARSTPPGADVASVLHTAQRIIANILGSPSKSRLFNRSRWSPGATSTLSRHRARVDRKMISLPISVTRRALPHFREELHADLHWCFALLGVFPEGAFCFMPNVFEVTQENRIVTVPKNAKTDRVIAAEPTANIFLQKGVGSYIRYRLRSFGVDLDDQGINQCMAQNAVHYGYATIDLSMASDTVALELVYDLLPVDWALLLDDLRSPSGKAPDGSIIKYEKFSSMGNGYTFELESLIFYALSQACITSHDLKCPPFVYGDDILIPSECFPLFEKVLAHCGFSVNPEKTHVSGSFFESCGKHFFGGVDVTPVYQKEVPVDLPDWIRLGNRLIRSRTRHPYVDAAWQAARRFGGGFHFAIPWDVEGDDGWVLPRESFNPLERCRNRGFKCRVIRFLPKREVVDERALLAYRLRETSAASTGPLDWWPSKGVPTPFDGTVTRDVSRRYKSSTRWVIPPWAEMTDLR